MFKLYKILNVGLLLLVFDMMGLYISVGIAHYIRIGSAVSILNIPLLGIAFLTVIVLYVMNAYSLERQTSIIRLAARTTTAIIVIGVIVTSIIYLTRSEEFDPVFWRSILLISFACFLILAVIIRCLGSIVVRRYYKVSKWIVVGNGKKAQRLYKDHKEMFAESELYFISGDFQNKKNDLDQKNASKSIEQIELNETIESHDYEGIILASDENLDETTISALMSVRLKGIRIYEMEDYYEQVFFRVPVLSLEDGWFAFSSGFALLHHDIGLKIKRVLDVLISIMVLLFSLPIMVIAYVVIRITDGGPVFYTQERITVGGKKFILYKFRTMIEGAEIQGERWAEVNDERITKMGKLLRKSRFDELPQVWNVLKGDMSFIGPRPERPSFVKRLESKIPYYDFRHLVKPGITGWAQVMYPYGSSIEEGLRKLEYDLYYIKNYSVILDLYILLRTMRVVFSNSGR